MHVFSKNIANLEKYDEQHELNKIFQIKFISRSKYKDLNIYFDWKDVLLYFSMKIKPKFLLMTNRIFYLINNWN